MQSASGQQLALGIDQKPVSELKYGWAIFRIKPYSDCGRPLNSPPFLRQHNGAPLPSK